jgi:hypothetical protein
VYAALTSARRERDVRFWLSGPASVGSGPAFHSRLRTSVAGVGRPHRSSCSSSMRILSSSFTKPSYGWTPNSGRACGLTRAQRKPLYEAER